VGRVDALTILVSSAETLQVTKRRPAPPSLNDRALAAEDADGSEQHFRNST
jgi:hypothetical protein